MSTLYKKCKMKYTVKHQFSQLRFASNLQQTEMFFSKWQKLAEMNIYHIICNMNCTAVYLLIPQHCQKSSALYLWPKKWMTAKHGNMLKEKYCQNYIIKIISKNVVFVLRKLCLVNQHFTLLTDKCCDA